MVEIVKFLCDILYDKKAEDIVILDLRELTDFTSYFIICTALSDIHAKAVADAVIEKMKKEKGQLPSSLEGYDFGHWVLIDYSDVIVHIFLEKEREYYNLELLWADAKKENYKK